MTQPVQSYFKPHVQMFDMGRWERRPFMNMLIDATEGTCNEVCQAQVDLAVAWRALHSPPLLSCYMQAFAPLLWFAIGLQSNLSPTAFRSECNVIFAQPLGDPPVLLQLAGCQIAD